jgi:LPS-assembly protein
MTPRIHGLSRAAALSLLGATALASPSVAETLFESSGTGTGMPDMTEMLDLPSVPLTATSGISALAPSADALTSSPVGDGTPTSDVPAVADADTNVTIAGGTQNRSDAAATVLADNVLVKDDRTLIAAGGVVVWYQGTRLVASRIIVDGESGDLTIEGPIHLSQPGSTANESTILIADSAQLDRELQDGIINGARLVLNRELQMAATTLERRDNGNVSELTNVVASSCQVCASNPTPLWEIRARKITHDAEAQEITFDHPQLRAFGVPIAAAPFTLTAPDPTVKRRSGFLSPEFRTTSSLGFGVKIPYFKTLGDSADLTVTPYLAVNETTTLELRYRQAFTNGAVEWNGAITRDDIESDETRGYFFGAARFDLPRGYTLGVQLQVATDRAYLLDYDITDADRLWSGVSLERVTRDKLFWARVGNYQSYREDEDDATSPSQVADVLWRRRLTPSIIGGEATLEWSAHAHRRSSDEDIVGRDVARASVGIDWRRSTILPGGVVAAAIAGLDADIYRITQDSEYDDVVTRVDPQIGTEFRWPLSTTRNGATHIVEPILQLIYSPNHGSDDVPNEDSPLVELDEGNLFSDDLFSGYDARETGLRANLGTTWTRIDPSGWSLGVTGGRIFRARDQNLFDDDSPVGGSRSDWLLSVNYDSGKNLAIANRVLFNDDYKVSREELRMGWLRDDLQVSGGYLWIDSDTDESRDEDVSELSATIGWQIKDGWWGTAETRYDFVADSAQKASLEVAYTNECITVETELSRRFTSSDTVNAETSLGVSVTLAGFGQTQDSSGTVARRSCMR